MCKKCALVPEDLNTLLIRKSMYVKYIYFLKGTHLRSPVQVTAGYRTIYFIVWHAQLHYSLSFLDRQDQTREIGYNTCIIM